jgi:hypothetical protein
LAIHERAVDVGKKDRDFFRCHKGPSLAELRQFFKVRDLILARKQKPPQVGTL